MLSKLLICTDLSPASDALVLCVEELKLVGMKEVLLTHVMPYADAPLAEDARKALERQEKMLIDQGVTVTVHLPAGPPDATISEIAETHAVSAIVVGSHGKGIMQAAAIGSVSGEILHQARRPVLLARIALLADGRCEAVCRRLFSRVLFPTDFSAASEKVLDYLGPLAQEARVPVTLLHVMGHQPSDAEARHAEETAQYLLEAKRRRLEKAGALDVSTAVIWGDAEVEIAHFAQRGNFSLIVMGHQGMGLVKELFMGSVAHAMARHAAVPVLFVPVPA